MNNLFKLTIKKENTQDIKIEGKIKSDSPMNMSTRIFIAEKTIPDFISTLQSVTPELIADKTHKPIKNDIDDIEFTIESFQYGDLLTIANNHIKEDGTIDNYGVLDIPYIFQGIPNKVFINQICDELKEYIK